MVTDAAAERCELALITDAKTIERPACSLSPWNHRGTGAVRALLGGHGYPQMVLQFSRANTAIATPRRPHAEMLAPPPAD
jgi:hypothetical protein